MKEYVIGLDFGTLSGRAVLIDLRNGAEVAEAVLNYPHAVMDERLPSGRELPASFALQDPQDYLLVLQTVVPQVLQKAGVTAQQIAGIGMDFTSCTMLPLDENGMPLCMQQELREDPHAYVKLWKHHAAQPQADEVNALARARNEAWLSDYGGEISCEWMLPKILEILQHAPHIYEKTARFAEVPDWLVWLLTGVESHSAQQAGYKAIWSPERGYPSDAFFTALDPRLQGIVGSKLSEKILPVGELAGYLSASGAALLGLCEGIPMAVPLIDGHAAAPALGITEAGQLMMVIGTSCNLFVHSETSAPVDGICGHVRDGVIQGLDTYEAGQACAGDAFDWFVHNGVPAELTQEAEERGMRIHALLRERAIRLKPGESGLLALDWLNGNRCVLGNTSLSGMMLGMTLRTKPEEIYRAWIEATVFGSKRILDQLTNAGVTVNSICACGGIALKDEMMMQIYADVFGREVRVADSRQACASGAAIYAAVACGAYPTVQAAAHAMAHTEGKVYHPNPEHTAAYEKLYREYCTLHDYFGTGENRVMERLRAL